MTRLELLELLADAITPEPKNSVEFAIMEAKKHNDKVDELAIKVYEAYLPKGEQIALERMKIYQNKHYLHYSRFI